jgi:hypothetical protein
MPDYTKVEMVSILPYTAPCNGFFYFTAKYSPCYVSIKINNVDITGEGIMQCARGLEGAVNMCTLAIARAETISVNNGAFYKAMFCPLRGCNVN